MESDRRLDSPPPPSRFRRPWSPDPLESFDSSRYNRGREPSDVSVEALDLADYAMSLPRRVTRLYDNQHNFTQHDPYPPSPRGRPFAQSRDSLHPPSLASPGGTLSTTTSASRSPRDRPWSLPPRSQDPPTSPQRSVPRIANPDDYLISDEPYSYQDRESGIDVGRFPAFTRHWYSNRRPTERFSPSAYHSVPNTENVSPFDPAYPTHKRNSIDFHHSSQKQPLSDFGYHSLPSSHDSHSRNILPWVNEIQDPLTEHLDPEVKRERIRMLEREFAGNGVGKAPDYDENMIGSADRRGRLITQGPKKRLAIRWIQALLTLGAAVSLIYMALVTSSKPERMVRPLTSDIRQSNRGNNPHHKERYPFTPSMSCPLSLSFLSPTSSLSSLIAASVGKKTQTLRDRWVRKVWWSYLSNICQEGANTKAPREKRRRKSRRAIRKEVATFRLISLSIPIFLVVVVVVETRRRKSTMRRIQVGWVPTAGDPVEATEGGREGRRGEASLRVWH